MSHEDDNVRNITEKTWNPAKIKYEETRKFDNPNVKPDRRFSHPLNNILSMFYGMSEVSKLQKQYVSN